MKAMDKRQRAMLKQMGVRVWQPLPQQTPVASASSALPVLPVLPVLQAQSAIDSGAASARIHYPSATFYIKKQSVKAVSTDAQAEVSASTPAWRVGAAQTLYADTAVQTTARWLVLLETPASALQEDFNPLDGDAGKLLDNMLRAAKLHTAATVLLAPLVRNAAIGADGDLPTALTDLLATAKANVVLVMGRLAAQAVLQTTKPLPTLRGQVHAVQGQQLIVTIDPAYLLNNPLNKAKVWDDLCLAISVA